jgi:two-component system sensor histidine kinase RegB
MSNAFEERDLNQSRFLRLSTLARIRWLAVAGQSAALLLVNTAFGFPFPAIWCAALVAASAVLNFYLSIRFPAAQRLSARGLFSVLMFDVLQLAGLLYLTGGLQNPFSLLIIVPVVISATALPVTLTVMLGVTAITLASLLALYRAPLPWYPGETFDLPLIYVAGMWGGIVSSLVFTAVFAWRVASEGRQLADALSATELVLQREQHLTAIDGLAAAAAHELGTPLATIALVGKEMSKALAGDARFSEDLTLLNAQIARCRDILKRLSTLETDSPHFLDRIPLTAMIDEVIAPHREFGVEIRQVTRNDGASEPVASRNPGVMYGLGNIVENAVDFARKTVTVDMRWSAENASVEVTDDGTGFPSGMIDHLGEPYHSGRPARRERESGGGLGLGLFIAKTLLIRSGANVVFSNGTEPGQGARVTVTWPRRALEAGRK